ncbi:MAG: peptidylprolyl isomerase [Pirellulaceae bacterium]|nr:peptidylprolyl isomerase [Pirellulaceae bacterium]
MGNEPILAGDLLPQINQMLEPYQGQASDEELTQQREKLMRQLLSQAIEYKLLYQDFQRSLPADKRQEVMANAEAKLFEEFDEKQLAKLLKNAKVATPAELDAKLRKYGSSLERQKRDFLEQQLARAQLSRQVQFNPEITHDDMLQRYQEKLENYAITPAVRWEQLTVKFENFPDKASAFRALAEMGNEVLRGAPFDAVARRRSQGPQAEQGGQHDWTEQGSLVSVPLDQAIFSLPVGKLSQIIEDNRGFHIVRVVERREAGRVPFTEAQVDIKEELRKERVQVEVKKYLEGLKTSIRVWNAFDDQPQSADLGGY